MKTVEEIVEEIPMASPFKNHVITKLDGVDRATTLLEMIIQITEHSPEAILTGEEDYSPLRFSRDELEALHILYKEWVDVDALSNRAGNKLNDVSSNIWEKEYNADMITLLVKSGGVIAAIPSYYGWQDFEKTKDLRSRNREDIAGIFNMKEDSWDEFIDSFADDSTRHGIFAEVLYKTGESYFVRYEGSFSDFMPRNTL